MGTDHDVLMLTTDELIARMNSRVRCGYPSDDPATAEDWEECDLPLGHDPDRDHEARHMWWPTRSEDKS